MPAPSPILVTGSTGLLGGAVVRRLVADDRPVRVLSRRPGEGAPSGIETFIGDISDEAVLHAAVAGVSAVIHAAGPMQGPDDVLYRSVYLASRRFAEIARAAGVERFVYVSTVAVYGHGRLADIDETHPIAPVSSYARAKAAAEDAVREAFRGAEGQSAWIIRPTNIYGPNDRHFGPLITALGQHAVIPLVNGGAVPFDAVRADDVADLLIRAADRHPPAVGTVLHAAGGEGLTVKEMVDRLRTRFGLPCRTIDVPDPSNPPPEARADLLGLLAEPRRFSVARALELLDWRPSARFPDGMDISFPGRSDLG